MEMSLDIFGPSTTEEITMDARHPTLGFEFHSPNRTATPSIKACKSGTQTARLKNWRSRFRHGTIRAIDGEYIDSIDDVHLTIQRLLESKTPHM